MNQRFVDEIANSLDFDRPGDRGGVEYPADVCGSWVVNRDLSRNIK